MKNIGIFDISGLNTNPLNNNPFSPNYTKYSPFWSSLPAYEHANSFLKSLEKNDVILVISGTGSGKTVLIPRFCLHFNNYKGKTIITLPKKIITKKAAEFMALTLDVNLGEQVGYQFRGENKKSDNTNLLYSTDGSIISMLKKDIVLKDYDIVIIDEAHERKVNIDLLLYLLRKGMTERKKQKIKQLKLIIMSATINESIFRNYFKQFNYDFKFLSGKPNFPIDSIYLNNSILNKQNLYIIKGIELINQIHNKYPSGDILFFVTSISECKNIYYKLSKSIKNAFIMPLYSGISKDNEEFISNINKYKELNSSFIRRIFISTNVAESSLTIDGIIYVIDSGLELNVFYNPKLKCNIMTKTLITKAQISQRKGRAGRTNHGTCYHLYTMEEEKNAEDFPPPEIRTVDLKNVCLSLLKLGYELDKDFKIDDVLNMLLEFIEPPREAYIIDAFEYIEKMNLLENKKLNDLGNLVVESRLDINDAIIMFNAVKIGKNTFYETLKIVSILGMLKRGYSDFFVDDLDENIIKEYIMDVKNNNEVYNNDFILLYYLFEHIKNDKNNKILNYSFFNNINKIFHKQKHNLFNIFNKFINNNINSEEENKENKKENIQEIIKCINEGYKNNVCILKNDKYYYNNEEIELDNDYLEIKSKKIIFYSNIMINNKLKVSILSQI